MPIIPPDINLVVEAFTQFTSISVLTSGGFKVVYRAEGTAGVEALKLIEIPNDPDVVDIETFRNEMFGRTRREIDALRRCTLPELVRLGTIDPVRIRLGDREFVAYSEEFLSGSNLGQIMRSARNSNSFPPISELRLLFSSGLRVVEALWAEGYVHRDIKPLNVIKEGGTRPFVFLDLGIAFSVIESSLTPNPANIPGTTPYMAPEMFSPDFRQNIDYRSDLYSLAVTVYQYASHKHPILESAENEYQTISRLLRDRARPLQSFRPDLPHSFCRTIDQMLRKQPALRPSNIPALLAEMEG